MRWLAATVVLVATSLSLVAWVYLRDRGPTGSRPPERTLALSDARIVFADLGGTRCTRGCGVRLIGRSAPRRWRARITMGRRIRCFDIDLDHFALVARQGLTGVQAVHCDTGKDLASAGG